MDFLKVVARGIFLVNNEVFLGGGSMGKREILHRPQKHRLFEISRFETRACSASERGKTGCLHRDCGK